MAEQRPTATTAPRALTTLVRPGAWPAHWPLTLMFVPFPLWWVLGLTVIAPLALSMVMAFQLYQRRATLLTPPGFRLWLLFLAWVALGVLVLWVDAPQAVAGGGGFSRLLIFGYRFALYSAATVVLLWITNLTQRELPSRLVMQVMGWMFVVTVAGGLLGLLAPTFEFLSPVELLVPKGVRDNEFLGSMIHPDSASIQTVLGDADPRPKAPFAFANSWGSNVALFLPFFLAAWLYRGARWQRLLAPVVLGVAAIPVIDSLNRALWAALAVMFLLATIALIGRGRLLASSAMATVGVIAILVFLASPLYGTFQARLDNPHSNERRGELLQATAESTLEGSPVVGFGSTRDFQGNFASIAGGDRPGCEACAVPPLGTQGHLWMLIFSQGYVGAVLFVAFLVLWLVRTWRVPSAEEAIAFFVVVVFCTLLPVYDTLDLPVLTLMAAIGLAWRAQRDRVRRERSGSTVPAVAAQLRSAAPVLAGTALAGALVGGAVAMLQPAPYTATAEVLLHPSPGALTEGALEDVVLPAGSTIDTEANLVVSDASLRRALDTDDRSRVAELRRSISIVAPPNTQVLDITVQAGTGRQAARRAAAVASSYIETRRSYLIERRKNALTALDEALSELDPNDRSDSALAREELLRSAVADVVASAVSAGELIGAPHPRAGRRQFEVPVASGIALGLLVGLALQWFRTGHTLRRARP